MKALERWRKAVRALSCASAGIPQSITNLCCAIQNGLLAKWAEACPEPHCEPQIGMGVKRVEGCTKRLDVACKSDSYREMVGIPVVPLPLASVAV